MIAKVKKKHAMPAVDRMRSQSMLGLGTLVPKGEGRVLNTNPAPVSVRLQPNLLGSGSSGLVMQMPLSTPDDSWHCGPGRSVIKISLSVRFNDSFNTENRMIRRLWGPSGKERREQMLAVCCVPTLYHPPVAFGDNKETRNSFIMPYYKPIGSCAHAADTTLQFVRDVARALKYMHSHGYVYGDVKPPNAFMNETETGFLLGDFTLLSPRHTYQIPLFTHWYRPPELFGDGTTSDPRTGDVWALGVSALEVMRGKYPTWGRKTDEDTHACLQSLSLIHISEPTRPY